MELRNNLSKEERQYLGTEDLDNIYALSKDALIRAKCNHVESGEYNALIHYDGTDEVRCAICHTEFHPLTPDKQENFYEGLEASINVITDTIETIKLLDPADHEDAVRVYEAIAVIKALPDMMERAIERFNKKHEHQPVKNPLDQLDEIAKNAAVNGSINYSANAVPSFAGIAEPAPKFNRPTE